MIDTIHLLASNIAGLRYEDLPRSSIDAVKLAILDCISVTLAGAGEAGVREVMDAHEAWGSVPRSTVVVHGVRLAPHDAAMVNAIMSHALELDDAHYPAIVHPTTPTFWTGLATAEDIGSVSGQTLIAAIAGGVDLMARLGLAGRGTIDTGFHTALYSVFGAAAVAGRLRKLDAARQAAAFGIAAPQAAGWVQSGMDGALIKRIQPGLNISSGMKAVDYAQRGISGVENVLDGKFGFFRLYNRGRYDREALVGGLGARYLVDELTTKRYPTSRCSHGAIEGTLALARAHAISADAVEKVLVEVPRGSFSREQEPFSPGRGNPQVAAQFSIDYNVAAALRWGEVFIPQIRPEAIRDAKVLDLARRVTIAEHPDAAEDPYLPTRITLSTKDGRTFNHSVTALRGSPQLPLTWDEVIDERLNRCIAVAPWHPDSRQLEELVALLKNLEDVPDVSRIAHLLTPLQ